VLRRLLRPLALGLLLLCVTVACTGDDVERLSPDSPDPEAPDASDPADDVITIAYDTPDGGSTTLAAYAGTPVVLNFFASTCSPCITEMPEFEGVHQDLGADVTFVGIAVQDRPDDAADIVRRTGVTYDTGLDPDGTIFQAIGGVALPTTALIRADGSIATVRTGAVSEGKLRDLIRDDLGVG
jgi:cytochrome c biogenesis protein CcmG/thiol:disulfide interchange protein DsbE